MAPEILQRSLQVTAENYVIYCLVLACGGRRSGAAELRRAGVSQSNVYNTSYVNNRSSFASNV
jgi:hypothetical protein